MPSYDAVLFDNDGVLVDPPADETKIEAARDAFREVGVETPEEPHLVDLIEGVTPDLLSDVAGAYDLDPTDLWDARERHDERSQFEQFEAGTRSTYDDIESVTTLDHPRGIVSSNHHSTIEYILEFFDLHGEFDTYYGREMTVESLTLKKPNPHYLDLALADLHAETGVYVGDSESDVVAAHRAGLDSVFVRRDHNRDVDLGPEPTYEVESLDALPQFVE